mmetsp:Transcript_4393/g.6335  ORF Transcript_4393/g.6335 Transcript_4393/m.6335 type:complete len:294 (-) Transcript_4393:137-1018(-)
MSATTSNDNNDHRPLIKDLIEEHAATIQTVKSDIQEDPLYDAKRYDDIWILRFVLSQKTAARATKAAISTMHYREKNKLNDLGDMRRNFLHPQQDDILMDIQKKYLYCNPEWSFILCHFNEDKGLVKIVDMHKAGMKEMAAELTKDDILLNYTYMNEAVYQILDEVTRRTGRLTKICNILYLGPDFSVRSFSPTYTRLDSKAAKMMQAFYPQMLGAVLVVDAPSTIGAVWKVMKPLFPKSVAEKFDFIYPSTKEKDVEPLLKYAAKEDLPKFLGGTRENWPPTEQRKTSNAFM